MLRSYNQQTVIRVRIILACCITAGVAVTLFLLSQRQQARLNSRLLDAVAYGTVDQAKQLLAQGASTEARRRAEPITCWEPMIRLKTWVHDPTSPYQLGFTPLMLACIRGDEAMVAVLLRYGADTGACESTLGSGPTPLKLATSYKHAGIVQMLKQAGPLHRY